MIKLIQNVSILLFFYVVFFQYGFYFFPGMLLFFLGNSKFKFSELQLKILLSFPYVFYFVRYIAAFDKNLDHIWIRITNPNYYMGARFLDLQQVFFSVKCNFDPITNFNFNFSNLEKSCPWTANYGPLLEIVPYFGNIWRDTLITSGIVIIFVLSFYNFFLKLFPKNRILVLIIFLSPSINFLIERMNIDIFILLICSYVIYNYKKYPNIFSFCLLILSLIKLHPIGFILGLIAYGYAIKNKKIIKTNTISFMLFIILYSFAAFIKGEALSTKWRPDDPLTTFGLFSDANYLSKYFSTSVALTYLLIIIFLTLSYKILLSKNMKKIKINSESEMLIFYSFSVFFIVNMLYANFDYRLPLFIPLILLFATNQNYYKNIFFCLFILLLPFGFPPIVGNSEAKFIVEFLLAVGGKISLYYFFLIIFNNLINDLKLNIKNIKKN